MYRGATKSSARLMEFAARRRAPVVTTCLLCRDNLRSAARELRLRVPVLLWPEFFRAASTTGLSGPPTAGAPTAAADPTTREERPDD
jgi:hypothetical protein